MKIITINKFKLVAFVQVYSHLRAFVLLYHIIHKVITNLYWIVSNVYFRSLKPCLLSSNTIKIMACVITVSLSTSVWIEKQQLNIFHSSKLAWNRITICPKQLEIMFNITMQERKVDFKNIICLSSNIYTTFCSSF